MILAATTGTFQGGFYSGGLAESWTGMCRLPEEEALWESTFGFVHDPLDEDILAKVMEAQAKIIAGDISVPSGYG
jgi:basic membrane lipoprotein Med (substrate-binding protein (PBP1-ABC) superfamily)